MGAVPGDGGSDRFADGGGPHAERVLKFAAVDDKGFLELVHHLHAFIRES